MQLKGLISISFYRTIAADLVICKGVCHLLPFVFTRSTLVIGGAGSLMLDLYGWESVFYVSGVLSVLWAYCMWKYLLKGEGKGGANCVHNGFYGMAIIS